MHKFINLIFIIMENDKITSKIINFIENDYKFAYSFNCNLDSYDDIIEYWNKFYLSQMNSNLINLLKIDDNLDKDIKEELNIIFSSHFNSSDDHMVLLYLSHLDHIIIKLKYDDIDESIMPFWTVKISSKNILDQMKLYGIKKNELAVLVYN